MDALPVLKIPLHTSLRNFCLAPCAVIELISGCRQNLYEMERSYLIHSVVVSYSLRSLDERHVALNYYYWYRHVLLFEYQ